MNKPFFKRYPYGSEDEVERMASLLSAVSKKPDAAAVIDWWGRDSDDSPGHCELPGVVKKMETGSGSLIQYSYSSRISLDSRLSSSYLFIRAMRRLGAEYLLLYMPAIPLTDGLPDVIAVKDHINMLSRPPHFALKPGENESMFFAMNDAYETDIALEALKANKMESVVGNLLGVGEGQFDTEAGHSAARKLGADLMSPYIFGQCLIAKRAGMKVAAFAETRKCKRRMIEPLLESTLRILKGK